MNESNIEYLINELKNEKDKYTQEIIANRIGQFKSEYTANLVGKMLEIEDTRIRNTAIEILQDMGEMCINTISKMVYHNDKNVRKFILDIIKEIKTEKSSLVALAALNDNDDNIVQTAVEIVNYNRYIPAIPKLLDILKVTNNIWIIVALINAFSTLGEKSAAQHIEERLDEISLSTLEKNIIINYYVKALGDIGSIRHLEKTMTIYKNMFQIDDDNLDYCINGIVTRNEVDTLSLDVISLIQEYYEDKINSKNPKLTLDNIRTAVKLGFIFSIDSIELLKELLINSPSEDYFEGLFEIVANQKDLSKDIISELIKHNDSQINVFTLRLIRRRRILGFNEFVKSFLISGIDTNMCVEALNVVTRIESYYDKEILNRFVNCNNHELSKIAIQGIKLESVSDRDTLMKIFIGSNTDLRKIIVKRFIENSKFIDIDKIIEIIREAKDSAIVEALEILFYIDSKRAGEVIDETLDNEDKEIRKKIVRIMKLIGTDDDFYKYMYIMAQDCEAEVRRVVIREISKESKHRAFVFLKGLLESENDVQNKYEIICNLYKYKFEDCYKLIVQNLENSNLLLKIAAITSLGAYGDKRAIEYLSELIKDINPDIRECVQEALYRLEVVK
ncbi:HEAT repeat domain-containing protein [Clostridium saccharobutylicum]|nr:HEAT repeat domain-containing protein [Clostridium saccharobutylicum]AQR90315.1 hypothetical protein CLOSC_20300 [Clostridium saccharobutylicum]AQS00221.1 hypothetical protein CSACC_20370 [Clostridium saccharobutylicum]AQS10020.1 hypothetical protein CLOBY_21590 [Clostridium saccharobutylicum]AQS14204.1 hypothetical protein CLOSACC_20370 [Clostridium saccharobutylicum]MBA8790085.1 HEAT repeat protein [Clostridium saccharobutylicum]